MTTARILGLGTKRPRIAESAFIAPGATVIGEVDIADGASVWFGCVLRGDVGAIRIGARTNIQDLSMGHMTDDLSVLDVGADVTIGHGVILHGCRIEDRCLIGMGSILLDNAVVGSGSLIAAGSLVPSRLVIPPGSFVLGRPAKVVRPVSEKELQLIEAGALHYVANAQRYKRELS